MRKVSHFKVNNDKVARISKNQTVHRNQLRLFSPQYRAESSSKKHHYLFKSPEQNKKLDLLF